MSLQSFTSKLWYGGSPLPPPNHFYYNATRNFLLPIGIRLTSFLSHKGTSFNSDAFLERSPDSGGHNAGRPNCCGSGMVAVMNGDKPLDSEYVCQGCGNRVELWNAEFLWELRQLVKREKWLPTL